MTKLLTFILLIAVSGVAVAQQSETRTVGAFTGVKAAEGIDVYLKKGEKESVKVEVTGNIRLSDVLTEISGSFLKIHLRDGRHEHNISVKVYVSYTQLDKLSASSAGSIFSEGTIKANSMEISASSAGTIEVAIETNSLTTNSSSAADIELKGKAGSINAEASSAGEIDAYDLECQEVDAEASSGASIKINVVKTLKANASSGGSIRYRGNPDKSFTDSSSGGSVKRSN